ncbi:uncharacterized protein DUF349 [Flavobacterium araucananum]|uniref:Chromosome segregation protein n=1 Tax=Flavobacterium araucananum TaxID=946678 RepID=A0A227P9J8_9FLAO|nr:DUF349 domain-containing protein [Flavobacterium araucananum]OXG06581.1 chromosome segregation protein [Flavobacterium araucananum]PWK00928.1 uncharacterized protein DUF349 [Flavobacterium araucananum]
MLEEKNDNLQEADGKLEIEISDSTQDNATETSEPETAAENSTTVIETEAENTAEATDDNHQTALDAITNSNAEESEDETLKERHDIPMQDYDTFSLDALVDELKKLINTDKVMSVKDHIEEIKKSFLLQYNHLIEEKKEEFNASNQDPNEEFEYHSPLKSKFDEYYTVFREKRNAHFKHLQTNLKSNLDNRLAIVEELKELINPQENIKDTLKHFNDLRERWKNAGAIPKDKYNHVWNNYHFHVENFYDYLHLDREARDLDFKYNLEQKQKIIARVEELANETDISKAFRELQDLHRIWKEDIGPVSKEHRDTIWNKFSELTKKIHDKREVLFESQRANEHNNLEVKKEIIAKIEVLGTEKVNSHSQWLVQIQKVETLRNEFFTAGKVPSDVNEETWAAFKTAVRNFNSFKNSFYKDIKKDQNDNLNKKMALVAKAKELQESTDFSATTPVMKQIQEEWKQIGHVPKKYSDKIWKEFKDACNHYFDKLKEHKSEENVDEVAAFDNKKAYLDILRAYQLTGDHKTDLDAIKAHIEIWKGYGKVPFSRRHIEGKFNKILDALFEKLSLSKKETEMMRFSNRIDSLSDSNDTRKLDNEKIFLMRKIEEVQNEIFQLENNIQFFTNTKNAKKENSIVLEVRKNIAVHKESLELWKDKLKQLRNLGQE